MQRSGAGEVRTKLRRIAIEAGQLPGLRRVAEPIYRRMFQRPRQPEAQYYGIYDSYAQALSDAPPTLPTSYDVEASGRMYRNHLDQIKVSDYPVLHWLSRLLAAGSREVFDLGGHIGMQALGYRWQSFERHLQVPFAVGCDMDSHHGFNFRRHPESASADLPVRGAESPAHAPHSATA